MPPALHASSTLMRSRLRRSASRGPATGLHRHMLALLAKIMFCNDTDADQTAFTRSVLVPKAPQLMTEPASRVRMPPAS